MKTLHIIDTSIYLDILRLPKHVNSEERLLQTINDFEKYHKRMDDFILPFGTIIETGSHIADAVDGRRYNIINKFASDVECAIRDETPYRLVGIPQGVTGFNDVMRWIQQYRELAKGGLSLVDTMCIDVFNDVKENFPRCRVRIWSYDDHLISYDTHPHSDRE